MLIHLRTVDWKLSGVTIHLAFSCVWTTVIIIFQERYSLSAVLCKREDDLWDIASMYKCKPSMKWIIMKHIYSQMVHLFQSTDPLTQWHSAQTCSFHSGQKKKKLTLVNILLRWKAEKEEFFSVKPLHSIVSLLFPLSQLQLNSVASSLSHSVYNCTTEMFCFYNFLFYFYCVLNQWWCQSSFC